MKNPFHPDNHGPWYIACAMFALALAWLLVNEPPAQPVNPAASLHCYLQHCYAASSGSDREREAFKEVFRGEQRRFAGNAEKMYSCEAYDHFVVTAGGYWLLLLAAPDEFQNGWIEFDCKIREFNVAESLKYYETNLPR